MINTVWEDTLIIALRDLQWRKAIAPYLDGSDGFHARSKEANFPGMLLKFDGNAESKVGDVLTSTQQGLYFLIEFKSSQNEVASEWRGKGKYLYHFLSELCDLAKSKDQQEQVTAKAMIRVCLAAHHLAYWTGAKKVTPDLSAGVISCLPYLEGVRESLRREPENTGVGDYGYLPQSKVVVAIDDFFNADTPLHEYQDRQEGSEPIPIVRGIDIHDMQIYLEWLSHDENDDSVKMALLDSDLSIVAISAKLSKLLDVTNELVSAFTPTFVKGPGGTRTKSKQGEINSAFKSDAAPVAKKAHQQAAKAVAALNLKNNQVKSDSE
jgi:hypothetical protein